MRRRAVLRQGRICAILLGLGKELMRLNVLQGLRADLLTLACPLRSTPFCEEAGTPKFLLEVILGRVFSESEVLNSVWVAVWRKDKECSFVMMKNSLELET